MPHSVSAFWSGGLLVPNIACSPSVMAFISLGSPSTCAVSFHDNDGIMSFGVFFQLNFLPSWIDLVLASSCC